MSVQEVLARKGPRKLLALDGGGIRGLITIEVLAKIESVLREQSGKRDLLLADYFDYVAGTSTGAVIGSLVALGYPAAEIRRIYLDFGRMMFDKGTIISRMEKLGVPFQNEAETAWNLARATSSYVRSFFGKAIAKAAPDAGSRQAVQDALFDAYSRYPDAPLVKQLQELIGGDDVTLGTSKLRTLLLLVLSNATTDSPWPVSNNPQAKYNLPTNPDGTPRDDCNLNVPLWKLVRGSTAAPTFFPPEAVRLGAKTYVFVDGGVTSYNNPAFQLFLSATLPQYGIGWPAGADRMLLVSIGTGLNPRERPDLTRGDMQAVEAAKSAAAALFSAAMYQQDQLCRALGNCLEGSYDLDREVGSLVKTEIQGAPDLFTYVRYNAQLTQPWMTDALGLPNVVPDRVKMLDSVDFMPDLQTVGRAVAERFVKPEHFAGFSAS